MYDYRRRFFGFVVKTGPLRVRLPPTAGGTPKTKHRTLAPSGAEGKRCVLYFRQLAGSSTFFLSAKQRKRYEDIINIYVFKQ